MGATIRDDSVVEAELGEDMLKKDLGDVRGGGGFVARAENYPLRKAMVYHDQNRIEATGQGKIHDEIHRDLLERVGAFGQDRGKWGVGRVSVHLVGLTSGATGDEFVDECGYAGPPIVLLEKRDGVEVSPVSTSKGFVDVFGWGMLGGLRNVKVSLVVQGALVEVPVLGGGSG